MCTFSLPAQHYHYDLSQQGARHEQYSGLSPDNWSIAGNFRDKTGSHVIVGIVSRSDKFT
jgi:hypothetical protein